MSPECAIVAENEKILAKLKPTECAILLGEQGIPLSSNELATRLADWQAMGQDLAFIIGGPDGVSEDLAQRANFAWSLSKMTLPHGFVRVLFAEQLYRAWSLIIGHPYHRE